MSNHFFATGQRTEAEYLVRTYHYSHRIPSNVQVVGSLHEPGGLFGESGPMLAACFFCIPPARWSEDVWELARLVRRDDVDVPLTVLIAKTCAFIRAHRSIDLLVSYADSTQGHHGGIYQAASWRYAGQKARMDGVIVDGVFTPGRSANGLWGTQSPAKLAEKLGRPVEGHYDEGKHLYWRALRDAGKRQAARLGLADLPYPKPADVDTRLGASPPARSTRGAPGGSGHTTASPTVHPEPPAATREEASC